MPLHSGKAGSPLPPPCCCSALPSSSSFCSSRYGAVGPSAMSEELVPRQDLGLRVRLTPGAVARQGVLWLICIAALAPAYFLVVTSLKDKSEYLVNMWGLPRHPTFGNFS